MKIGIVGTGNMGRSLGVLCALHGHEVYFGSRDEQKARTAALLAVKPAGAGTNQEAAAFGDLIVWAARGAPAKEIVSDASSLAGKPLIDLNNNENRTDGGFGSAGALSFAERLQAELPEAQVVKAFNTLPMEVLEVEEAELRDKQVSVFLASDSESAKVTVRELVEELGFAPFDFGPLRNARLLEALADVFRHAIHQGASLYGCLSIVNLPKPERTRLGGRQPSKLR